MSVAPRSRPDPNRLDEQRLVEWARTDANAFAELYRRYVERIHAYAFRRSGSQAVAEDVTSATFEKALRGLGSYRWKEPGIGPWLFRIASNELVNYYRHDDRQVQAAASLASSTVPSSTSVGQPLEDTAEMLMALATIRPRYQRALTLRYFADLTNEEAAAAMGVTRATMAVVLHRGMNALRKAIEASRLSEEVRHGR